MEHELMINENIANSISTHDLTIILDLKISSAVQSLIDERALFNNYLHILYTLE